MTNVPKERTVEEIVEELYLKWYSYDEPENNQYGFMAQDGRVRVEFLANWLTQTLQAERQKREESVRELYQALKYQNTERELRAETHERMGIKLAFDQFILQFCTKHGIDRETLTNNVTEKEV